MIYRWLFPLLWIVFIAFWIAMARGGKAVAEREDAYSRLSHYGPLAVGVCLLAAPRVPIFPLDARFAPLALWPVQLGAALTFAGIAFAIWARVWIAGNWSSDVTLKRGHELLAVGEWRGVLAVALAAVSFWRKLTIEEAVMRRQFGEAYARYAARTAALIPFVG
jgi:protein-S-isoprenylcysteine O-methyltransferase Ste14